MHLTSRAARHFARGTPLIQIYPDSVSIRFQSTHNPRTQFARCALHAQARGEDGVVTHGRVEAVEHEPVLGPARNDAGGKQHHASKGGEQQARSEHGQCLEHMARGCLAKAIDQAIRGATNIQCFDAWVEELVSTGYLHNHTRMWFASIWIFTLNLPWARGADFFMQHLCDADAASNTLSWRWVAGLHTAGKHYLARADNIFRYTNHRFNPIGQLNESAPPKTESVGAQSRLTGSSNVHPNYQSMPISSATVREKGVDKRAWLLLHDEDLSPEEWLVQDQIAGIIVLNSATARSANGIGHVSAKFSDGALDDATNRLRRRWHLDDQQVIYCASPTQLAKQLGEHKTFAEAPIVHAWIPVGATRDALTDPVNQLRNQGITFQSVLSEWDQMAWPHATEGFFKFRARIPTLLNDTVQGSL